MSTLGPRGVVGSTLREGGCVVGMHNAITLGGIPASEFYPLGVTPLVFHNRDPNAISSNSSEIDDVRKSAHKASSDLAGDDHPTLWRRRQRQNLTLKFIDKLDAQARAALSIA